VTRKQQLLEQRLKELRAEPTVNFKIRNDIGASITAKPKSRGGPPVLVINGYAGSLTVAATNLGLKILGSFEDQGHGLEIQRRNFPKLSYVETYPWPDLDLRDALVIAHPPCAGFCAQNVNAPSRATTRGLDGTYFAQTRAVLDYSLAKKPLAVLVESVKNAYEPTKPFYDELAARHGYHVYRVLQNAVTFGTAQWRPRFWAVLVRMDVAPTPFVFQHDANRKSVGEVLAGVKPGEHIRGVERTIRIQREKMIAAGMPERLADEVLSGEHGYGATNRILPRAGLVKVKPGHDREFLKKWCYSLFVSNNPVVLDPEGYAPTVMSTSCWLFEGKPLTAPAYNALMGYPLDYWFSMETHLSLRSQGVCPPVAQWLLEQVIANLTGKQQKVTVNMTSVQALQPGDTANFLIGRGDWAQRDFRFNQRPLPNRNGGEPHEDLERTSRLEAKNKNFVQAYGDDNVNKIKIVKAARRLLELQLKTTDLIEEVLREAGEERREPPPATYEIGDDGSNPKKLKGHAAVRQAQTSSVAQTVVAPTAAKKPRVKRADVANARFRLVAKPATNADYLKQLLTPHEKTHNAHVARALAMGGKTGLTFVEMVAAVKNSGWKTSSPNPEGILRWHLGHLEHERGLVERV
jgi:site-specific DNA-cytosine methylase